MNRKQRRQQLNKDNILRAHCKFLAKNKEELKVEYIEKEQGRLIAKIKLEGYLSTKAKDGSGDIVDPSGIDLSRFENGNAPLKSMHGQGILSNVGVIYKAETDDNGLYIYAYTMLDITKDSNNRPINDHDYVLYDRIMNRTVNGFSIGFMPIDAKYDKEKQATVYTKIEVLEGSVVDIPDNPLTLIKSIENFKNKSLDKKIIIKAVEKSENLSVGDFVERNSSGGTAFGKIDAIEREEGEGFTPTNSDQLITADEDDPVAYIELYNRETMEGRDQFVVHKFSTLTLVDVSNNIYDSKQKDLGQDELDEVYAKYSDVTNMSASELKSRSENECSKLASVDRSPIDRNLRLLSKNKDERDATDVEDANKTISFIARMKENLGGENIVTDENGNKCGTKAFISLKNRAYDANKEKSFNNTNNKMMTDEMKLMVEEKIKEEMLSEITLMMCDEEKAIFSMMEEEEEKMYKVEFTIEEDVVTLGEVKELVEKATDPEIDEESGMEEGNETEEKSLEEDNKEDEEGSEKDEYEDKQDTEVKSKTFTGNNSELEKAKSLEKRVQELEEGVSVLLDVVKDVKQKNISLSKTLDKTLDTMSKIVVSKDVWSFTPEEDENKAVKGTKLYKQIKRLQNG